MTKRKLDEFLELAKDLSASDIAESLKALGPRKCRKIMSDPKVNTCIALQAVIANSDFTARPRHERHASTNNSSTV
jgi:arginyl-tRNA--protein-N-Asp/Glu arginylyltransferase